jgi:hypothetical protein
VTGAMRQSLVLMLVCGFGVTSANAWASEESGYRIAQSVHLPNRQGSLEILVDKRLTPPMVEQIWQSGAMVFDGTPQAEVFAKAHLLPAKLRLTAGGNAASDTVLEEASAVARIESSPFRDAGAPIYLVTTDDYASFGSYSGKPTFLFAVGDGQVRPVLASDDKGHQAPITLAETLKSVWQVVVGAGGTSEIEQVLCRPNFEKDGQFITRYITYRQVRGEWHRLEGSEDVFWEDDGDFPERSKFQ